MPSRLSRPHTPVAPWLTITVGCLFCLVAALAGELHTRLFPAPDPVARIAPAVLPPAVRPLESPAIPANKTG